MPPKRSTRTASAQSSDVVPPAPPAALKFRSTRTTAAASTADHTTDDDADDAAPVAPMSSASSAADTNSNPLFINGVIDTSSSSEDESPSPQLRPLHPPTPPPPEPIPLNLDSLSSDSDSDFDGLAGDEDENDEDDDDPVVRSYDVYVTSSDLSPHLFLFQYPVRDRTKPYSAAEKACPVEARYKPLSGLVEVDVPVNVRTHYDQEKGREWGDALRKANAIKELGNSAVGKSLGRKKVKVENDDENGANGDDLVFVNFEDALKKGRILDKQTLGSKIQPDDAQYMVAVIRDEDIHLTPLRSTLQLRPQFPHVDAQLAAERAQAKARRDEDHPPQPQEARRVQAVLKSTDDPNSQLTSSQRAQRIEESEEWTKIRWIDQEDDASWDMYEGLWKKREKEARKEAEKTGEEKKEGEKTQVDKKKEVEVDEKVAEEDAAETRLRSRTRKNDYMDWMSGAMWVRPPEEIIASKELEIQAKKANETNADANANANANETEKGKVRK